MKSKTSAVTPKKLASTLRDFQESNIKPLQDSLDTTQQMLSTIVDSIKKSSPSVVELEKPSDNSTEDSTLKFWNLWRRKLNWKTYLRLLLFNGR